MRTHDDSKNLKETAESWGEEPDLAAGILTIVITPLTVRIECLGVALLGNARYQNRAVPRTDDIFGALGNMTWIVDVGSVGL